VADELQQSGPRECRGGGGRGFRFREQIAPGAFTRSLASGADVVKLSFFNHDFQQSPRHWCALGTLTLQRYNGPKVAYRCALAPPSTKAHQNSPIYAQHRSTGTISENYFPVMALKTRGTKTCKTPKEIGFSKYFTSRTVAVSDHRRIARTSLFFPGLLRNRRIVQAGPGSAELPPITSSRPPSTVLSRSFPFTRSTAAPMRSADDRKTELQPAFGGSRCPKFGALAQLQWRGGARSVFANCPECGARL